MRSKTIKPTFKFKQKQEIEPKYFKIGDTWLSQEDWKEISKPATVGMLSPENCKSLYQ